MPKNMTRASVALAATAALVASGFAGLPATAAGQADTSFVALAPTSGEAYNVLAIAGQTFSLSANQASSITASGRNVKFLVSDPNEAVRPENGTATTTAAGATVVEDWKFVASTDVLTIKDTAHGLVDGDVVNIQGIVAVTDAATDTEATVNPGWRTITRVDANEFTVTLEDGVISADVTYVNANDNGGLLSGKDSTGTYFKFARAVNKSFVVNTGVATNTSDKVLVLRNIASTATVSVDVTAWVDDNGNGLIDTTEYVSPTRTVSFVSASTVVPTVTWTPVVIGDASATATVTLNPAINFDQQSQAHFEVDINRQGSSATIGSDDGSKVAESWDTDDQEWTITATLEEAAADLATPGWNVLAKKPALASFDKTATTDAAVDITHFSQSGTTATLFTDEPHNLSVNDTITVTNFLASAAGAKVTAVSDLSFSYTTTDTSATTAKTAVGANNPVATLVKFAFATAGDYKATVKLGSTPAKIGDTSVISAGTQVTAGVKNVATVTENVSADFKVRAGTVAAVQVTSTVTNSAGAAVAAGIPVSIAVTETSTGVVTVNGTTVTTSRTINTTTGAGGQVVITVTNSSGLNGQTVQLAVSSQGFSDTDTLTWETAAYALTDALDNSTAGVLERSVANGGDLAFNLNLKDQWGAAPAGDFRVKVTGAGTRYNFINYQSMSNGVVNFTLTDAPVNVADTTGTVVFDVEQKNAAGSWVTPNGTPLIALKADGAGELHGDTININVRSANGTTVSLNADGVGSADLSAASALKALVAADTRTPGVAANDLSLETGDVTATITGTIRDKFNGVAQAGSAVTLTGSSSILFVNGVQASFGSITVMANASGVFSVDAHSNAGLTDSEVTVTSNGASSTVKVTFTGAAADGGTTFELTAPASAAGGTTFQVTGQLKDKFGNGVQVTTAGDIRVTYTGPGLVVGTLPDITDKDGKFTFSVLLGSNDKGSAVITASYDQNSDDDFVDAKDLVVSKTVAIGQAAATDGKVNVGSFNGKLVVYALGLDGAKISWKVAGRWGTAVADGDTLNRFDRPVGAAGVNVIVEIYVDRVLRLTKTVLTR
jgi:trimeric autotransporter adhesin